MAAALQTVHFNPGRPLEDPEQNRRRIERYAWLALEQAYQMLADTDLHDQVGRRRALDRVARDRRRLEEIIAADDMIIGRGA